MAVAMKITPKMRKALNEFLDTLPVVIADYLRLGNGHIAGGAVRRMYEGFDLKDGDVDIFIPHVAVEAIWDIMVRENHWEKIEVIDRKNYPKRYQLIKLTKNGQRVDIIGRDDHMAETLIDDFDFSICQMAISWEDRHPSPKLTLTVGDRTLHDLEHRKLVPVKIKPEQGVGSLVMRIEKYVRMGFYLEEGGRQAIDDAFSRATF